MKEINFRAYDHANKEWFYFNLVPFFTEMSLLGTRFDNVFASKNIDPKTIGRELYIYPDGRRLYEGDILFHHQHWNECKNYDWHDPFPQAGCNHDTDEYIEVTDDVIAWEDQEGNPPLESYRLVGNIHENPELLEKSK